MFALLASTPSGIAPEAVGIIIAAVVGALLPEGYRYIKNRKNGVSSIASDIYSDPSRRFITRGEYDLDQRRLYDLCHKQGESLNQLIGLVTIIKDKLIK